MDFQLTNNFFKAVTIYWKVQLVTVVVSFFVKSARTGNCSHLRVEQVPLVSVFRTLIDSLSTSFHFNLQSQFKLNKKHNLGLTYILL